MKPLSERKACTRYRSIATCSTAAKLCSATAECDATVVVSQLSDGLCRFTAAAVAGFDSGNQGMDLGELALGGIPS